MIKKLLAVVALLLPLQASAMWVDRGVDVWSSVGGLYNFRLSMMRADDGKVLTFLSDCNSRQAIGISVSDDGREQLSNEPWFVIRPGTNAQGFTDYACEKEFNYPKGQWLAAPHGKGSSMQWSNVGELTNFRITLVSWGTKRYIHIIDCNTDQYREVAEMHGDTDQLYSHRKWAIEIEDMSIAKFACRK